jgi:ATP-binding cassette subfamily B protein
VTAALGLATARGDLDLGALTTYLGAAMGVAASGTWADAFELAYGTRSVPAVLELERRTEAALAHETLAGAASAEGLPRTGIRLEGVTFCYPGRATAALEGLDLFIPAGKSLAVVGENGAGKTTLVKLLCRLYEPSAGRVLVDGVDVRRLETGDWRARASAAFQDFQRFEFVVRETVGVGNLAAVSDRGQVQRALARAGGEDVPAALPAGLETMLGTGWDGGVDLSGGQWQKLALGRAFMREAPLLVVFDEPTAALDAPTEHALFERFAAAARSGASRGTVTLIVSHRFSTVRMADRILVLDGGRVVEQGSHTELLARGGLYTELYELQARAYRDPRMGAAGATETAQAPPAGVENSIRDQADRS